jgi:hypothetical protein
MISLPLRATGRPGKKNPVRNRVLLVPLAGCLALLMLGCTPGHGEVAGVNATPSRTLRPLFTVTTTPAPSHTPLTSDMLTSPSYTPIPSDTLPPPSDTPLPTAAPLPLTDTPAPSDTPAPTEAPPPPTQAPLPTATAWPLATRTAAPATNTPGSPQPDFRLVKQELVPKAENEAGLYTIYIRVEDAAGNPLNGLVVWDPGQPGLQAETGAKADYYHAEILMGGGDYYLEVKDARSERTKRLTTVITGISHPDLMAAGYCASNAECDTLGFQHFSWRVVFRRSW